MKGQLTLSSLIMIVVVMIVFFVFAPVLNSMINDLITNLEASPNAGTEATVAILALFLFVIVIAIALSALNQAVPRIETGRRR